MRLGVFSRSRGSMMAESYSTTPTQLWQTSTVTAAGLLRLVIEGEPLSASMFEDPVAEGGILGMHG